MKIFYLSREFPNPNNPAGGVFITYRIRALLARNIPLDVYFLRMKYRAFYRIYQKLRIKKKLKPIHGIIQKDGIKWIGLTYMIGFREAISKKSDPLSSQEQRYERLANKISSNIDFSKYDLIHCHVPYPEGYVGSLLHKLTGLPLIISCHGSDIHTNPKQDPIIEKFTVKALNDANSVIFVSNFLLESAKELGYSGNNAIVIPNGVDTARFTIQDRKARKKELGLSGIVIGYVGTLTQVKRADRFPEIFRHIHERLHETHFLIIGDGFLRQSVAEECRSSKLNCTFAGMVPPDRVPFYMGAMDILILPSRLEGFGCVALEAQASGVPVVGSDRGSIPEAIGDGGIIVSDGPDFEQRFADAVINALSTKWDPHQLRQRALDYDWSKTIQQEIDVYERVLVHE